MSSQLQKFRPGSWVVFRKDKTSTSPGPRAQMVHAAECGDTYRYVVEKFWLVQDVDDAGHVHLRTRSGKTHVISANDHRLRPASLWQRIIHRDRFQAIENSGGDAY